MAWIESHQELRNHPKTKRLARKLDIQPAAAVGHLHFLWWWSADYAPDGDLTEFDDWEIADAAGYEGDNPAEFKDALIFAGFLDNTNQGTLLLHDWMDYTGKKLQQLKEHSERNTGAYRKFRDAVLRRDGHACQMCGRRDRPLHVHHKKRFSKYPELRVTVSNGIALCEDCHREVHAHEKR